jgi:hypothetical protein
MPAKSMAALDVMLIHGHSTNSAAALAARRVTAVSDADQRRADVCD